MRRTTPSASATMEMTPVLAPEGWVSLAIGSVRSGQELVVQNSAENDREAPGARIELLVEAYPGALVGRIEFDLDGLDPTPVALGDGAIDFQLDRVEHDLSGRLMHRDRDGLLAGEGERAQVRIQENLVTLRRYCCRQPVVVSRNAGDRRFLIVHLSYLPLVGNLLLSAGQLGKRREPYAVSVEHRTKLGAGK